MITVQAQAILDNLQAVLLDKKKAYDAALNKFNVDDTQRLELIRQRDIHASNNNTADYNIVISQLLKQEGFVSQDQIYLDAAKKAYDAAVNDYQTALKQYTTPEERAAIVEQAKSESAIATATADNKLFVQKSTQYIIIGTIALLIVAAVAWAFKNQN